MKLKDLVLESPSIVDIESFDDRLYDSVENYKHTKQLVDNLKPIQKTQRYDLYRVKNNNQIQDSYVISSDDNKSNVTICRITYTVTNNGIIFNHVWKSMKWAKNLSLMKLYLQYLDTYNEIQSDINQTKRGKQLWAKLIEYCDMRPNDYDMFYKDAISGEEKNIRGDEFESIYELPQTMILRIGIRSR